MSANLIATSRYGTLQLWSCICRHQNSELFTFAAATWAVDNSNIVLYTPFLPMIVNVDLDVYVVLICTVIYLKTIAVANALFGSLLKTAREKEAMEHTHAKRTPTCLMNCCQHPCYNIASLSYRMAVAINHIHYRHRRYDIKMTIENDVVLMNKIMKLTNVILMKRFQWLQHLTAAVT